MASKHKTAAEIIASPELTKTTLDQAAHDAQAVQTLFERVFNRSPVEAYLSLKLFLETLRAAYAAEEMQSEKLDELAEARIAEVKARTEKQAAAVKGLVSAFLGIAEEKLKPEAQS